MPPPEINGIPYVHMVEHFIAGYDPGPFFSVKYHIDDYSSAFNFTDSLMGLGQELPHRYELAPHLFATPPAVVEGVGRPILNDEGLPIDYDGGAIVSVTYRSPSGLYGVLTPDQDPQQYEQIFDSTGGTTGPLLFCTQEIDHSLETGVLVNHNYVWDSTGAPAYLPVRWEVGLITMSLTFHRVRRVPEAQIRSCYNKVNGPGGTLTYPNGVPVPSSANPTGVFLGGARGHVKLLGAKSSRSVATDGTVQRSVQVVFQERERAWGKQLMPDGWSWDWLKDPISGNRQYEEVDFRPLLPNLMPSP